MRRVIASALVLAGACGGASPRSVPVEEMDQSVPISVEWKVDQAEGNDVNVAIVVDGRSIEVGALHAATEHEAGTPATCALRAASPRRTEIVCGDSNGYVADLVDGTLVITHVAEQRSEVKRVPVQGNTLAVKMLVLPGSKL